MTKLSLLLSVLNSLGFAKESGWLKSIIKSAAPPLEGFVPLDLYEPTGGSGWEEDKDGIPQERKLDRPKRRTRILRDKRNRGVPPRNEEEERAEVDEWYSALKSLGDSVILIPFDRTEVDGNEEILYGMSSIFGIGPVANYQKLKDKVFLIGGSNFKEGDRGTLKEVFPSLWADIQDILSSKGLEEEDVIYMFYNQETNPGRLAGFSKNPAYFGHDLGHADFDSEDSDGEFKMILCDFIRKAFKLYVPDDEGEGSEVEVEEGTTDRSAGREIDEEDLESSQKYLEEFFDTKNGRYDSFGDVFAAVASGEIRVVIPNDLYLSDSYHLPPESRGAAEALGKEVVERLKTYMNSNHSYGTFGYGPFSHLAGSVVLQDI